MAGAVLVNLAGCADAADPGSNEQQVATNSHQFFENSERRDASAAEASRVARIANIGCAAFFLENTARKVYVATARHCFDFHMDSWCAGGGGVVDNDGNQGKCLQIVAADPNHDIAVFESDIPHASSGDSTLVLASYVPKTGSKLIMTGYPVDSDPENPRRGKLTTTENCWTLTGSVESPFIGMDNDATIDKSARHNCSTYGGNSGGPMYIEGSRDAIGIPFMYQDDYTRRSATKIDTASYLALMSDFVGKHKSELDGAGIVVDQGSGATADSSSSGKSSESSSDKTKRPTGALQQADAAQGCTMSHGGGPGREGFWMLFAVSAITAGVARRRQPSALRAVGRRSGGPQRTMSVLPRG
jgi:hypothetical protein